MRQRGRQVGQRAERRGGQQCRRLAGSSWRRQCRESVPPRPARAASGWSRSSATSCEVSVQHTW